MFKDHLKVSYNKQQHDDISLNFQISKNLLLENFKVNKGVFKPDGIAAQRFAQFLSENPTFYKDKNVLDLGCGTGLQGIIMAICGSSQVTFADISPKAVINTLENIKGYNLESKSIILETNLFSEINTKYDLIIFNHPYFDAPASKDDSILSSITDSGDLLRKFLKEAREYLVDSGEIIMPYLPIAGEINNPSLRGKEYGYNVEVLFSDYLEKPDGDKLLFDIYKLY